jgi:hypothetical protein
LKGFVLKIIASLAATLVLAGTISHAATVNPVAYDTQGVGFGIYYLDDSYSGSTSGVGQQSYSGGLGQLTDGIIPSENYSAYENVSTPGGPYVAWGGLTNVIVGFDFDGLFNFTSATFYFDDMNGAFGVTQPIEVMINGISSLIPENSGATPFSFTLNLQGLAATDRLEATIKAGGHWTFLSEVDFNGSLATVPLPGGIGLMAGALALSLAMKRRRRV